MKYLNKTILTLASIATLAGATSCSEALDFSPTDRYSESIVWNNKENIESYLTSFYITPRNYSEFGAYAFGTQRYSTDGLTWMLKYNSDVNGYGTPNLVLFVPDQIKSSSNVLNYWNLYTQVRKINEFLDGFDKYCTVCTEEEGMAYKAEARFFRAWCYFLMARAHKAVIIYDYLPDWQNPAKARATEEETWNFIKEDLQFAYDNLKDARLTSGRVDKGAAAALLSRAMLYAQDWDAVIDAAEKVISIGYELDPDYASIFKHKKGTRSVESIYQIDYYDESYSHLYDSHVAPAGDDETAVRNCPAPTQEMVEHYEKATGGYVNWDNVKTASDLAAAYASLEPRFHASVLYNGAKWKGRTIETFVGGKDGYVKYGDGAPKTTVTGYYAKKLLDESNTSIVTEKSIQSCVAIRYAEVLLNYAEALIKSSSKKNITKAMQMINRVRDRVGLPGVSADSENAAMEALMHEREIELAFEGFHYWDLKRWRKAVDLLDGVSFHGIRITADGSFTFEDCDAGQKRLFPAKYYYLPIPDGELSNNPLCTQLEEWQ